MSRAVNLYLSTEVLNALDELAGPRERSALVSELILERAAAARRTIADLAREDRPRARAVICGALELHAGNARAAREQIERGLGISATEKSWRTAIEDLGLGEEIARRWPARRGVSGRKP